jgi:hypothetical protein
VRVLRASDGEVRLATEPVIDLIMSVAVGMWRGLAVVVAAGATGVRCWALLTGAPVPIVAPPWPALAVTLSPGGELWAVGASGVAVIEPSSSSRG